MSQIDDAVHSSSRTKEHAADNFSQFACRVIADSAEGVPTVDTLIIQRQKNCTSVETDDLLIGHKHFTATMKKEPHREGPIFKLIGSKSLSGCSVTRKSDLHFA